MGKAFILGKLPGGEFAHQVRPIYKGTAAHLLGHDCAAIDKAVQGRQGNAYPLGGISAGNPNVGRGIGRDFCGNLGGQLFELRFT